MTTLRPYQRDAINATLDYWAAGGGNPLVVMATGTGKSVVIATAVRELLESFPDMRVIMLTHVKELVAQNAKAMLAAWQQAPIGINSAGLGRRDKRSQILFASIQSVHKESATTLGRRDLILVDEAHLIPRSGSGMYLSFIERMREDVPDLRVAGYTATPYRLGSGRLDKGDDRIFDKIVYDYGIGEGIKDGYLSPLVSKATATALDLSGVKRAGGEFVAASLEAAIDQDWITRAAVSEMVAFGENRRSWLVFAAGVDHAFHLRDMIRQSGISCETVTGETPNGERDRIIRDFKEGRTRCLTNVGVLTTGFDAPSVDLVAMLRPTLSTGLYIQMVGRGTRLATGKQDCIAEGQRVLTDYGLVPIEHVTKDMKVWDGVEFVTHCGTVFRGEQEVIRYAGLEATTDHRVWTKEGWKAFGQCAVEQTPISVAGANECTIRTAEGRFRRDCPKEGSWQAALANRVHRLRFAITEGLHELAERLCRLSQVREPSASPQVACYERHCCQAEVYKSEGPELPLLWWQRNRVSIHISHAICSLGSGKFRFAQRDADRPDRQRWALRAWKFAISNSSTKYEQSERKAGGSEDAQISRSLSGSKVCRRDPLSPHSGGDVRRADHRAIQSPVLQTKRRVWDILNAGPRHSFTVEGLLVHNCLVLDFAGNVRRHGPVDAINITNERKKKKEGAVEVNEVRAKECPDCQTLVALNARECPTCGHSWKSDDGPKHDATADGDSYILSSAAPDWLRVASVELVRHEKPGGYPSLRVEYRVGIAVYRKWVCLEHPPGSLPRRKAEQWWAKMSGGEPPPETVNEALQRQGEMRVPDEIRIKPAGKYFEIVGERHDKVNNMAEAAE